VRLLEPLYEICSFAHVEALSVCVQQHIDYILGAKLKLNLRSSLPVLLVDSCIGFALNFVRDFLERRRSNQSFEEVREAGLLSVIGYKSKDTAFLVEFNIQEFPEWDRLLNVYLFSKGCPPATACSSSEMSASGLEIGWSQTIA
jgi:hypothetical protein